MYAVALNVLEGKSTGRSEEKRRRCGGARSRRTLFLQQGGVFGAVRHHRACSICADEGGGAGSAARPKSKATIESETPGRSREQSLASTRWRHARQRRAASDETRDAPEERFETMRSRGDAACGVLSRVRAKRSRAWVLRGTKIDKSWAWGLHAKKMKALTKCPHANL